MTGFLGKLPTVGDFISRNLPNVVTTGWMNLTDDALALGARRAGADWYEGCQDEPALCFALAPKALSESGWIGLLRPSVDSFARSYPFTVLAPLPRGVPCLAAPEALHAWYAKADIAVLSALEGSLTVERLGAVLGEIAAGLETAPDPACPAARLAPLQFDGESVQGWTAPAGSDDEAGKRAWYEMLLTEILSETDAPTLWWQLPAADAYPAGALLRRLPGPETFRALIAGDWRQPRPTAASEAEAAS